MSKIALIVVNFGGPRNLKEVPDFLEALLTDHDVVRTKLPKFFHNFLFKRIAKKRSVRVSEDYGRIGGKSPIFEDTEWVAQELESSLGIPTITFHRYLRKTHSEFIEKVKNLNEEEVWVFPLFPQFTYATSGSIARWFSENLDLSFTKKLNWVESYATHPSYIDAFSNRISQFLQENRLNEEEVFFIFSAHGVPESFIQEGDPYQKQCEASFSEISSRFSKASSLLSYQSQFGKARWIGPSTKSICENVEKFIGDKKHIVFIPLSFTSDHIETLFEVEEEYKAPLEERGYSAYRCPALGRNLEWIESIKTMLLDTLKVSNESLIRKELIRR